MIVRVPPPGPLFDAPSKPNGPPLTEQLVAQAEQRLGVKLPASYLEVLRKCNGGRLRRTRFPMHEATTWADDHVSVDSLLGIGGTEGTDTPSGTPYMVQEWGYPSPSVLLHSDGHTAVLLDYREVGPHGEPPVIFVDVEAPDPRVWTLAPDFGAFVAGLTYDEQRHSIGLPGLSLPAREVLQRLGARDIEEDLLGDVEGLLAGVPSRAGAPEANLSVGPNAFSDGSGWRFEEHPGCALVLETDVEDARLDAFLVRAEAALGCDLVLIEQANRLPDED